MARSSAPARYSRSLRLVAVALVAVLVAPTFGRGSAGAQTVDEKREEAQRVAARLDELEQQHEALQEQYHDAVAGLEQADAAVLAARAEVDATRADLGARRAEVQSYAVEAYMGAGDEEPLFGAEPAEGLARRAYLQAASGDRDDLIDQLRAAEEDLEQQIAELEGAKADAQALRDQAESAKDAAERKVAEQQDLKERVDGELAELVREEQERKAADEARRAEERAREQAARARQSPPPTAPSPTSGTAAGASATPAAEPPAVGESTSPGGPPPGAATAISVAYSLIGTPYVWAGASPSGFDCSGFTMYVWGQAGYSLPHSSTAQYAMTTHIPMSELQPGDLVFYGHPLHHVALYAGGGTIIHSPGAGKSVRTDSVYYWDELVGAGRLPS